MIELSAENAADYLRGQGQAGAGPVRVEALGGGVSNLVLRVVAANRTFVLKQSRPQLRTQDAWFSDLERVYREQEVMEALGPLLPPGTVPEVLFVDRENFLFAMSPAPARATVWKQRLLDGQVDVDFGGHVGDVLGRMHQASAAAADRFRAFADPTVFIQLRVDPFYRCIARRLPETAAAVGDLVEQMLTRREALCHGDYTPKNILVLGQGFTLVDYETAYFGDPAMDLGLCLCHLLLKAFRLPARRVDFLQLTEAFWRGYGGVATVPPLAQMQRRGIAHLGACLLARIAGTSPVNYLPQERQRDAVRDLGRTVLLDGLGRWEDVLAVQEKCWKAHC